MPCSPLVERLAPIAGIAAQGVQRPSVGTETDPEDGVGPPVEVAQGFQFIEPFPRCHFPEPDHPAPIR